MNAGVLRILDANLNRAREALRVLEDYARFALNDAATSAALKQLRHDLASATANVDADAILHRDTPADVGTASKATAELIRDDAAHVVTAAGKRLGEALRTIEEYLKTIDPSNAATVERIRYRFYDLEQRMALSLRATTARFAEVRLYVLLTESMCRLPWLEVAEAALRGGADCIQLREKDVGDGELLDRARRLVELCHRHGSLCVINDRPDIAMLARADGVHLGQQDLPARQVRKLVGSKMLIGVSTHVIGQARQAVLDGADYIGVGPVFPSRTKPRDFVAGLEYLRQVTGEIRLPAVAISGIDASNVDEVLKTGIRAIAVSSAVIAHDDPQQAARQLRCNLQPSETGCPKT